MQFTISRLDLLNMISKVQSIVPTNPALPVLVNVLLEVFDHQLVLIATDLTVTIRAHAQVSMQKEGSITLPARKFFQLIREFTAPTIVIDTLDSDSAHITCGASYFKLSGMPKTEFHSFTDSIHTETFKIANHVLKECLIRSAFSASRDDNRQVLNGILLTSKENTLTFIGTDGKRLSRVMAEIETLEQKNCECLIPLRSVEEMIKILEKDGMASVFFLPNKMGIQTGNITFITKLLYGQFPSIDNFIPEKSDHPIKLHREELMSLLRQVSLLMTEDNVAVHFHFKQGELQLTTASKVLGEGNTSMAVNYQGPNFGVAFHPNYFLDILRHSKDETMEINLKDSCNPALIKDSTKSDFVLIPMRVGKN